ncbi:MAG: GNAT family N-acetyltransferase [Actinomycetia bacterium]|nr:GNAT family N-acetyltransferase [Actinomycetes bacterium]
MSEPILRDVAALDLDRVLELNTAAVPAVSLVDHAELEWFLETAEWFPVVELDGEVVAFLIGLAYPPDCGYQSENWAWFMNQFDSFAYVDRIVVDSAAHGQGIGQFLYREFVAHARGRFPRLCAEVNTRPRNDQSLHFHEKFGFEEVGEQETGGGEKAVVMLSLDI